MCPREDFLPAAINNNGKVDTLLTVDVSDEIKPDDEKLKEVTIHLLLSDKSAQTLPDNERLDTVIVATWGHHNRRLDNIPAARGIENHIQIRLNNSLLEKQELSKGWIIFRVEPGFIAFIGDILNSGYESAPILDVNNNPIMIEDLQEFKNNLLSSYMEVVYDYWHDWESIRTERDLKKIADV